MVHNRIVTIKTVKNTKIPYFCHLEKVKRLCNKICLINVHKSTKCID